MTVYIARNSVGFSELLDHAQQESRRWHDWFKQHPQALDVKIDIAGSETVRDLLSHIVFVDLLFAEWLLGESTTLAAKIVPARINDSVDKSSPDTIFAAADSAVLKWRKVLDKTPDEKWDELMYFPASPGNLKASRRKCFTHAFLHGTRHWAKLATSLRRAGYKQDWQHDFIFSPAMQ
jgi:uncharacterized damage-inducible protein DinB